jgi:dTDP-4-amino-4,6-dideoxygalactose transaminase
MVLRADEVPARESSRLPAEAGSISRRSSRPLRRVKARASDLAVFGGEPTFETPVLVGRPNIGDRAAFNARLEKMFDDRWLSNDGPFLKELERRLAQYLDVTHCIAVCNATLGLQILFEALELTGEVIVPSFTFIATAHALKWQRLVPVFCDVDPVTHTIDPSEIEALISPATSAILGVHLWGQPCDIDALSTISQRHNLHLLFDSAHALGSTYRGKLVGAFGDAEVFSFHATKFFNSFEGGIITTNDEALAQKLRAARSFGFDGQGGVGALGTNAKMTEVAAAMGLTSLESIDEFIDTNRRHYQDYAELLAGLPGISLFRFDEHERHNYQYVVIEVDPQVLGLSRDQLQQLLAAEGVGTRRYFDPPCHLGQPYRTINPEVGARLPTTERLAERILQLPTGTAVTSDDVGAICDIVRLVSRDGQTVASLLDAVVPSAVAR